MPNEALVSSVSIPRATDVQHPARVSRYFQGMSILLLALVLIGFGRTFFLRPLFQVPAIPWYDYVHGSLMTLWFVLLVAQTSLVAAHRTDLHRRLGIFGALLAVAVAALTLAVLLLFPAHFTASGDELSTGERVSPSVAVGFLWGDLGAIAFFSVLVTTALLMRRRPDVHKRLMLLASMPIITPAVGRTTDFVPALLVVALVLLLPLTLVAHDLLTARRLHRATIFGVLGFYAIVFAFSNLLPATAAGRALWHALE